MKKYLSIILFLTLFIGGELFSQTIYYGGRLGLSLAREDKTTTSKLGLQIGGLLEYVTATNLAFETELNWNSQEGTPIEWALQLKYYFETNIRGLKPYLAIGGDLWFFGDGPYVGGKVGGGMDMQLSRYFVIPLDLQIGQVFMGDETANYFAGTTGIKFIF